MWHRAGEFDGTKRVIRQLPDEALAELQPLFEQVFKHPVSLELLRWKYADGRGESWLADDTQGSPAIHCGLFFRDVLHHGERFRAAQLVDLMAPPKPRGLRRSDSPFALLMDKVLKDLPRMNNPQGVAFGFPSERAMRLGERMGVYKAVDQWLELEFAPVRSRFGPRWRELHSINDYDAEKVNALWQNMALGLKAFALGVRDVAYLEQRYRAHPEKRYTLLMAESLWRRKPLGLAVIGPGDGRYELMDVVGAWKDVPTVVGAAQNWLADRGGQSLTLSLTERFARQLEPYATGCTPTQFRIMANPFSLPDGGQSLQGNWWLTGGDTDYR
jgi:hypothetical protein